MTAILVRFEGHGDGPGSGTSPPSYTVPSSRISPVVISIRWLRNAVEHGSEVPATQCSREIEIPASQDTCDSTTNRPEWLQQVRHLAKRRNAQDAPPPARRFAQCSRFPLAGIGASRACSGAAARPESSGRVIRAAAPRMSEIDLRHRRARPGGEQRGDERETRFVHCFVRQGRVTGGSAPKVEECPISQPRGRCGSEDPPLYCSALSSVRRRAALPVTNASTARLSVASTASTSGQPSIASIAPVPCIATILPM
jgi:hypothetical protein